MNRQRIRDIIEQLRYERFRFRPSRRIRIPKKSGGTRPLGIPDFSEKLVQEVLRQILEAYYEPRFRDSSHGFRPGRGCHTALANIKREFAGTVWFIEGDIRGCFDAISHDVLADDYILSFIGPRSEAKAIRVTITAFSQNLSLQSSRSCVY